MRRLLLALLLAASAAAQPVVGPEVTSAPLSNLDDYAIAPQRDGFVLAWTAEGRLFAGHLDATLHITAPPLTVPLFDPNATAALPAIASNGRSILVAWHERRAGYGETAFIALLTADGQRLVKGPNPVNITKDGPLATTVNGKYVVYTGDLRYVFNENLDTEEGTFISRNLGAALSENGEVATVNESATGHFDCRQICFGRCTGTPQPCTGTSTVTFLFGGVPSVATYAFVIPPNTFTGDPFSSSPPVVAANGDSYAGLVHLPDRTDVFFSNPFGQIAVPTIVSGQTALAGNGDDVLLVWTSPHPAGTVVHRDGSVSDPFAIETFGYQPRVVNIDSNDFAVLYRIDAGGDQSVIAGRIVHLQTPKRRSTH
jgi:hypothetical protein